MRWRLVPLTLLVAVLATLPGATAQAQLGGLKKQLAKVTGQVQPPGPPEAFTEVLLELDPVRLAQVIAGKQAGRVVAEGTAGPRALRQQLEEVEARLSTLSDANRQVINAWGEKREAMEDCRDEAFRERQKVRKEEYRSRTMRDPVFARKVGELSLAMQDAQLKGDSVLLRKVGKEVAALTALTGADSAAIAKACGSLADAPEVVRELAALEQRRAQLTEAIRQAEAAVSAAEAQASQMTGKQFGIAWERVQLYLGRRRAAQPQTGFSLTELQALTAQAEALEQLLK